MDPSYIRQLFDRHGASLVLYARQWCRCPDDAVQGGGPTTVITQGIDWAAVGVDIEMMEIAVTISIEERFCCRNSRETPAG